MKRPQTLLENPIIGALEKGDQITQFKNETSTSPTFSPHFFFKSGYFYSSVREFRRSESNSRSSSTDSSLMELLVPPTTRSAKSFLCSRHLLNFLFKSSLAYQFSYLYGFLLSNSVCSICCLSLHSWIPPLVIVNNLICLRQVQSKSTCL